MKFAIIGALTEEIEYFVKQFDAKLVNEKFKIYEGKYKNFDIVLCKCGIGKVNSATATQRIIDLYTPDFVINSGVAGGLSRELSTLDIALSEEVIYHDFHPLNLLDEDDILKSSSFKSDKKLLNAAIETCTEKKTDGTIANFTVGRILTGDCFVEDNDTSRRLRDDMKGICVEMEGGSIAQTCIINSVPFLIVRSISDFADDSADISYNQLVEKAAYHASIIIEGILCKLS